MEELRACRACLATDTVLFNIHDCRIADKFTHLTGSSVTLSDGLPQHLCNICCIALHRCTTFRNSCILTQDLLNNAVVQHNVINTEFIRNLDRQSLGITPQLTITKSEVTHEFTHIENDIKQERDITFEPKLETDIIFSHNVLKTNEPNNYGTQSENNNNIDQTEGLKNEICSPSISEDDEPLLNCLKDSKIIIRPIEKVEKPIEKVEPIKKVEKAIKRVKKPIDKVKKPIKKVGRKVFNKDYCKVLVLTKEEQLKEVRAREHSKNYINSPFKCDKCFKGFIAEGSYINHMVRHDASNGTHICDICQMRFQFAHMLRSHCTAIHKKKYQCNECDHVSNSTDQAKQHYGLHQGITYSCQFCEQTFKKRTSHLSHVRIHHPSQFVCELCGESFIKALGLAIHKKKTHNENKKVLFKMESYCDNCKIQFESISALKKHINSSAKHNGDNTYSISCTVCGGCFENDSQLIEHSKLHEEKPYQCDQCDASFAKYGTRVDHFRRKHLGIKKYRPIVVCEVCGKKCESKAALSYHQRTHTGEKPYQCTICTKRFRLPGNRNIHVRSHTDNRPHQCSQCQKAFKEKTALTKHLLTHSGLKPHTCNYCAKSFTQSNSLKLHVNTVHLKLPQPYRNRKRKVHEKKSKNASKELV